MAKLNLKQFVFTLFLGCTVFAQAGSFRNVALSSSITTLEPLKGIVFWPDNDKITQYQNSIALEYSYCLYSDVVNTTKGVYDWTKFEALLDDIASRGHQAIIRFRYEYPGPDGAINGVAGATAVPAYIKALPGYTETYNADTGGDGETYYADWRNSELQAFTKEFYTKFAERYDNDPRIAFVQTGFGHWGEYHIYGTTLNLGVNFPSKAFQKEFLQHMDTTFKHTPWSISIDAADTEYTPIVGDNSLMNLHFGVFDDSFMHKTHDLSSGDGYNETNWNSLNRSRWKFAPGGGEISYYTSSDQKNALNPAGMYGGTFEQRAAQYHISYMIGNDVTTGSYATVARVKEASLACGYKFQITAYQVSETEAKVSVKNIGIAPLYHDAYVSVKGVRAANSLKGLLPDSTQTYIVSGLSIGGAESPSLTITSDKLLTGKTIPYQASLTASGINQAIADNLIRQKGNFLCFEGTDFIAEIYTINGNLIEKTRNSGLDISALPSGCYLVKYTAKSGEVGVKKIIK